MLSIDCTLQVPPPKMRRGESNTRPREKGTKVKWSLLLLLGGATLFLLAFWAVLRGVVLQSHPSFVWNCFLPLGCCCLLLPPFVWCCITLLSFWVVVLARLAPFWWYLSVSSFSWWCCFPHSPLGCVVCLLFPSGISYLCFFGCFVS